MFRCRFICVLCLFTLACFVAAEQPQSAFDKQEGLPPSAMPLIRLGNTAWRHDATVGFAAFLPDGKSVVTASSDYTIRVWEYPSGKEISRIDIPAPTPPLTKGSKDYLLLAAALSKDGKLIATCFIEGKTAPVRVHEIATGKELPALNEHEKGVRQLAFSPSGEELVSIDDVGMVRAWNLRQPQKVRHFAVPEGKGQNIHYAPDGKSIITVHSRSNGNGILAPVTRILKFWDPKTDMEIATVPIADDIGALRPCFSHDGKMLAFIDSRQSFTLLDTATGKTIRKVAYDPLTGNASVFRELVFGEDGTKLYALSAMARIALEFDTTTGKQTRRLTFKSASGNQSPSNLPRNGEISLSPDGKTLVLAGYDHTPQFLDLVSGKSIAVAKGVTAPLLSIQFAGDGKSLFTRTQNGSLQKWDAATGKDLGKVISPMPYKPPSRAGRSSEKPHVLEISADGKGLLVFRPEPLGDMLSLVDAASGKELAETMAPYADLDDHLPILLSADGKMLAIRGDSAIELFGIPADPGFGAVTMEMVRRLNFDTKGARQERTPGAMFLSPDKALLAAYTGAKTLAVWDTATGLQLGTVPMPASNPIKSLAFAHGNRCLAFDMNDGTAILHELASGRPRATFGKAAPKEIDPDRQFDFDFLLREKRQPGPGIAITHTGDLLALAAPDRVIRVWDIDTGKELAAFKGHTANVNAIAFAPDGKTLASASADTTALIWDLSKIKRQATPVKFQARELDTQWQALAESDAVKAFAAIQALAAAPKESIPLIKDHIQPAAAVELKHVQELIGHLGEEKFQVRDKAMVELLKIGEPILPELDKALKAKLPLETATRLQQLRSKLTSMVLEGERLRQYRAAEVLERIGTPEARQVLQALAEGAPGALLTISSQKALRR